MSIWIITEYLAVALKISPHVGALVFAWLDWLKASPGPMTNVWSSSNRKGFNASVGTLLLLAPQSRPLTCLIILDSNKKKVVENFWALIRSFRGEGTKRDRWATVGAVGAPQGPSVEPCCGTKATMLQNVTLYRFSFLWAIIAITMVLLTLCWWFLKSVFFVVIDIWQQQIEVLNYIWM